MKFSISLLSLFVGAAMAQPDALTQLTPANAADHYFEIEDALIDEEGHRDLQIVQLACGIIGALLPGDVTCECTVDLVNGLAFMCAFNKQICVGGDTGFCSAPTVMGIVDILNFQVGFEFCAAGATNGGEAVPGICVDFGADLEGGLLGADSSVVRTCTATIDNQACSSCEVCDGGRGYIFDCSEISSEMVQSECTTVSLITGLNPNQDIQFLPHLD